MAESISSYDSGLNASENWSSDPDLISNNKYQFGKKINAGSFGDIRLARDIETKEMFCAKLELVAAKEKTLANEFKLYTKLESYDRQTIHPKHIPRVLQFDKCGLYNVLVMDLLGLSLYDILNECNGSFSLKSVLLIAKQILESVEYIHSKNIIHRDIKPGNFVIGRRSMGSQNVVYLIDFGLSEEFMVFNKHVPFINTYQCQGTVEFMSVNVHKNHRPSRRDDLESVIYTLMYLSKGSNFVDVPLYPQSMIQWKEQPAFTFCKGFPSQFAKCLAYIRALEYTETPNYDLIKNEFQQLFHQHNFEDDRIFDWTKKNLPEINVF